MHFKSNFIGYSKCKMLAPENLFHIYHSIYDFDTLITF